MLYTSYRVAAPRKNWSDDLWIPAPYQRPFFIAFAIVLLARCQILFNFTYSVDDYRQIISGLPSIANAIVGQGRFGEYWLFLLFDFVGVDPLRAPLITVFFSCFISVWVSSIILVMWDVRLSKLAFATLILVISLHPYTAELFTFRGITIYHYVALGVAFMSMRLADFTVLRIVISAVLFSIALTIYQIPLSYVGVFIVFDAAIRLVRYITDNDNKTISFYLNHRFVSRIISCLVGILIYLILFKISTMNVTLSRRATLISMEEVPDRILQGIILLLDHFITGQAYQNSLLPLSIMVVPFLFLCVAIYQGAARTRGLGAAASVAGVILIASFLGGFAMLGVAFLSKIPFMPSRVLPQIGVVWAGCAVLALSSSRKAPMQVCSAVLCLVSFVFIAQAQQIFIDHYRIGVRDHLQVRLVLSRLQINPNFVNVRRIAVVGRDPGYGVSTPTRASDLNRSVWRATWSIAPMFTELSGWTFNKARKEDYAVAKNYCNPVQRWPSQNSTTVIGDLAIVCFQ